MVVKKVLLADDCPALRTGVRSILEQSGEFSVESEVDNPSALLRVARESKPDLIVVDATLARDSSLSAIEELRADVPQCSVLVFSGRDEARAVRRALRAGAVGYLLKSGSNDEILGAARLIASGKSYLSPNISDHLVNAILEEDESENALSGLTRREREVLRLVAEGYSSREIAGNLGVSAKTIETHRSRLMSKLGIHKTSKLVRFAFEAGVLDH